MLCSSMKTPPASSPNISSTPKPAVTPQGVKGAEKTPIAPPVAHQDTSSGANWGRAALFLFLALILGAVAVLRHRRVHPREVEVEVMQPRSCVRFIGIAFALLIALTGYGEDRHRRLAREAGFDQHITKPVDASKLEELLKLQL